ncbi:MAG: hypothetical protein IPI88_07790 [Chitinophagaceae bacterium]|nr:hypothetical protein [Chitinophagaceae bacterium]
MLVFSFCAKAQENNPFTTGFEKRLPSKILDEQRTVWIHIPTSNGGIGNTGKGRYPVIYLLDGDTRDGALWWNDQQIVKEAKLALANTKYKGKTLFMALANRMEKGMDTLQVQKDTTEGTELIRSNLEFIKDISKNKPNQLRFRHAYYENDDHGSVRLIGEYDALRFIFDYYKLKIYNSELDDPNFKMDSLLVTHYNNVSEQIGYPVKPAENQVNGLAYYMLRQKQFIKAEALFKLNITNYPGSANCYDGLGDLYLAKGIRQKL